MISVRHMYSLNLTRGTKLTELNTKKNLHSVFPENIHTPTTEGIGNSRGVGGSKSQEIPEGMGGKRRNFRPEGRKSIDFLRMSIGAFYLL